MRSIKQNPLAFFMEVAELLSDMGIEIIE